MINRIDFLFYLLYLAVTEFLPSQPYWLDSHMYCYLLDEITTRETTVLHKDSFLNH